MSNNQVLDFQENSVLPKLRFTEFEQEAQWDIKKLANIATFLKGKGISKADIDETGVIPCIRYGELYTTYNEIIDKVLSKTNIPTSNLVFSKKNDVIIPSSGETQEDIAKASCVMLDDIALGGDLNIIRSNENGVFISYYLNSSLKSEISKIAQGNAVVHLYANQLKKLEIAIPSPSEQEKIVNCLSSLDKLIESASIKLKLYVKHRTGVLQQLFPKDGENLPKLRLGKFSQEWENIELSKIAKPVKKKNSNEDELKVLSLSNEHGLVSQADYFLKRVAGDNTDRYIILQKNDFVYNDRITKNSTYGTIKRLSLYDSGIVSPIYKCFRFEKKQNPIFWEYFFESKIHESEIKQIVNEGARAGRYNISIDKFLSISVMQPSLPEQEKIASCLTSLDRLISHQKNYIEQLKRHKKGLMQQLFPVVEEI
ncbi:MAG: restriction endonuclease subunit S [Acinetobacter venetianus]|uniref:restriction endonuclease subunit S n=1 Tax=Acinetobacter venetianus TaxID=52133 RepID=UPI003C706A4F